MVELTAKAKIASIKKAIGAPLSESEHYLALDFETTRRVQGGGHFPGEMADPDDPSKPVSASPLQFGLAHLKLNEFGQLVPDPNRQITGTVWPEFREGNIDFLRRKLGERIRKGEESVTVGKFTGLTEEQFIGQAVSQEHMALAILKEMQGMTTVNIIGHNLPFDVTILKSIASRYGLTVPTIIMRDTYAIEEAIMGREKNLNTLEAASKRLGVAIGTAHNALVDALTSVAVFNKRYAEYGPTTTPEMEAHAKLTEPKKNPAAMHHTSYTGRPDEHPSVKQAPLIEKHESVIPKTFAEQVNVPGLPVQEPVRLDNLNMGSATTAQQSLRVGQGTMTAKEMQDRIRTGVRRLVEKGVITAEEAAFDMLWQTEAGVSSDPTQAVMYGRGPAQGAYAATFMQGEEKISLELRGLGRTMYDRPGAQYQERAFGVVTESGAAAVVGGYFNVAGEYDPRRPQEGFQPSYQPEYRSPEEHLALTVIRAFSAGKRHRLIGGVRADPYTSQRAVSDLLIEGTTLGDKDIAPQAAVPGGALVLSHENLVRNLRMVYEYSTRLGLAVTTKSSVQTNLVMGWMNEWMETGIRAVDSPELRGVRYEKPDSENLFGGGPARKITARGYRFAYNVRGTTGVSGSNIVENDPAQLAKMTYAKGKIGPFGSVQDIAYPWYEFEGEANEWPALGPRKSRYTGRTQRQARYEMSNVSLQDEMLPEPEWTQQTFMVSGKILSGAGIMSREAFMQKGMGGVNVVASQEQYAIPIENLNRLVEEHVAVDAEGKTVVYKTGKQKGQPKMLPTLILPSKHVFRKLRRGGSDIPVMSWLEKQEDELLHIAPERITQTGDVRSGSVRVNIGPSRGLLERMDIGLPKYMNLATGEGVTDPTDVFEVDPDTGEYILPEGYGRTEEVIGKQLQERLSKEYGGLVTLSYRNRPAALTAYLQREVAVSTKGGIGTFKQGNVPGSALTGQITLDTQSRYSAEIARIMGSGTANITNIAGDIKQPARALVSGFGHMPRKQQADLIKRLLPGTDDLATWIESQPAHDTMSLDEVARRYATTKDIPGAEEYSGLEFAQELLGSIMSMTPEQNAQLYRDFGIGRAKGTVHIGVASEGTRIFYQTEARRIEAEKYEKELLSVMQEKERSRRNVEFMRDYFTKSHGNAPVDLSYMKMILPGAVYSELLGLGELDQRKAARRIANFLDKKVSQRLGFSAIQNSGYFEVTQELEGLMLPTAALHRPEYISTSFRLGYEGMMALSSQFPTFAKAVGYYPGQDVSVGASRSDEGWLATLSADMFRQETKKGLGFIESENVAVINKQTAERIYARMSKGDRPEILLDNQKIIEEEYKAVTGNSLPANAILKFERDVPGEEKFVDYLQSPGAMAAMDVPDITGTSRSHYAVMYNNALSNALRATWEGGADTKEAATESLNKIYNKFETAGLGRKTELGRMLTGRRVGAGFFGHFQPLMQLGLQEVVASDDIALVFARQAGFKTVDAFYNWIDEVTAGTEHQGKLPGYFMRVPQLSREGGVLPTFLLTPSEMKRRGIYDPDIFKSPRFQGILWTSPTVATSQVGDFDDDPLGYILSISTTQDEKGHWARTLIEDPNAIAQLRSKDKAYMARVKSQLEAMFGEGADKYNVVRNELLESGFDEKDQWEVLSKKAAGGKRYDLHQLTVAIQTKILNDSIKARAYQAMRAMEAAGVAGAAMGGKGYTEAEWQAVTDKAITSMTAIYQRGLDLKVTPGEGISSLENMISSMKVIFDPAFGSDIANATKISFRPDPKETNAFYPWQSTGNELHPTAGLRKMAINIAGMKYISEEALAYSLSDPGNRESYERIFNAISGKSIEERKEIVSKMVDTKQITSSATTWRFMLAGAARRFATNSETADFVDVATIPYWGEGDKAIPVSEFIKKQDVLLTNTLYDVFTSDVGNLAKTGLTGQARALQGIFNPGELYGVNMALSAFTKVSTGAGVGRATLIETILARDLPREFTKEQAQAVYDKFFGGPGKSTLRVGASEAYGTGMREVAPFPLPGTDPRKWSPQLARVVLNNMMTALGRPGSDPFLSWGPELTRGVEQEEKLLKSFNEDIGASFTGTRAYIEEGGKRVRRPGGILPIETPYGTVEFEMHMDAVDAATGNIAEIKTVSGDVFYREAKEKGMSDEQALQYAIQKGKEKVLNNPAYRMQATIYSMGMARYRSLFEQSDIALAEAQSSGDTVKLSKAMRERDLLEARTSQEFEYAGLSDTSLRQFIYAKPPKIGNQAPGWGPPFSRVRYDPETEALKAGLGGAEIGIAMAGPSGVEIVKKTQDIPSYGELQDVHGIIGTEVAGKTYYTQGKFNLYGEAAVVGQAIAIQQAAQTGVQNVGEILRNVPRAVAGMQNLPLRGTALNAPFALEAGEDIINASMSVKEILGGPSTPFRPYVPTGQPPIPRSQTPAASSGGGDRGGANQPPTITVAGEAPGTPPGGGGYFRMHPDDLAFLANLSGASEETTTRAGAAFGGRGKGLAAQARTMEKAAAEYQQWQTPTREGGRTRLIETLVETTGELGLTPKDLMGKSQIEIEQALYEAARKMGIADPEQRAERVARAIPKELTEFSKQLAAAEAQATVVEGPAGQSEYTSDATRKTLRSLLQKDPSYRAERREVERLAARLGEVRESAISTEHVSEAKAQKEKSLPLSGAAREVLSELEEKMGKVTEAAKKYNDVLKDHDATSKDATKAMREYQNAIASLKPSQAAMTFVDEFQKAIRKEFKTREELFAEGKKYVAWAKGEGEAPEWVPAKERTGAKFDAHRMKATAVEQMMAATEMDLSQEKAMRQELAAEGGLQARFGKLARTLFGGWGLMYMGSIGRLITRGAYSGLQEREQMEMQFAAPFQQQFGGPMPYTPQQEEARILATQYGGSGGMALQRAMNYVMREQQPVYNMANMALGGVSAMGFTAFVAGAEGVPRQQAMRWSAGMGAATMFATTALNVGGALADVPGSALSIATRQNAGQNVYQPNVGAIIGGIGSGATIGFMAGGPWGALAGGVIGGGLGAVSDYPAFASLLNPDIQRQATVIQQMGTFGNFGMSPSEILSRNNISQDQLPYYSRMAAASRLQQFPGYSEGALGYAYVQGAKYDTALSDNQIKLLAEMATKGVDTEQIARGVLSLSGMTAGEMNKLVGMGRVEMPGMSMRVKREPTILERFMYSPNLRDMTREFYTVGQGPPMYTSAPQSYVMAFQNIVAQTYAGNQLGLEAFQEGVTAMAQLPAGLRESMWGEVPEQKTPQEYFDWLVEQGGQYGELEKRGWLPYYATASMQEETAKALNLPYKRTPSPWSSAWAGGPDALQRQIQMGIEQAYTSQQQGLTQQIYQNLTSLGWTTGGGQGLVGATGGQMGLLTNLANRIQFSQSTAAGLQRGGMEFGRAQEIANAFIPMSGLDYAMFSGAMSMDPMRLMQVSMQSPGFGAGTLTNMYGAQVGIGNFGMTGYTDVTQSIVGGGYTQFTPTGLRWGTTSLANATAGLTSQQMGAQIFGTGAGMSQGAMQSLIQGGYRGYQDRMMNLSYQNQMAQIGIGYAQIALQEQYQPQFWALEDRSRQLGYQQQEWRFDFSQRQLNASDYWWNQNRGLEKRQMTMQREWAREDWGYQDQTRALQWQWRQEDFQESIRFTTGRERRLGERQMRRDTIMHNLEEEQIDKQRDRQKELWKLEDERFKMSKEQHDQQIAFQQEELDKSREFYQLRKALELEQVKLQREYWKEQMELQKRSLGIQAAYATEMHKSEKALLAVQRAAEDADGQVRTLADEAFAGLAEQLANGVPLFDAYIDKARELNRVMEAMVGAQGGGRDDDYEPEEGGPRAGGGPVIAGTLYPINEYGREYFRPNVNGTIIPLNGDSKNPWNNSVTSTISSTVQQTVIIVNLGNETLGKYVSRSIMKEIEL